MLKKAAVPLLGLLIVVLAGCASTKMAGPPPTSTAHGRAARQAGRGRTRWC